MMNSQSTYPTPTSTLYFSPQQPNSQTNVNIPTNSNGLGIPLPPSTMNNNPNNPNNNNNTISFYPSQYSTYGNAPTSSGYPMIPTGQMQSGPSMSQYTAPSSQVPSVPAQGYNQIQVNWKIAFTSGGLDGEPPLLQELGINFDHIRMKTVAVLNPIRPIDRHIMDDADLAGPLLFCFLFGIFLLMTGKNNFPYIYGVATMGCVSMYCVLNLMSENGINWATTSSVLGYCLLPIVLLSLIGAFFGLNGYIGFILSGIAIYWCTFSASNMFVSVLGMKDQRILVAYPIALLYAIFALMSVF